LKKTANFGTFSLKDENRKQTAPHGSKRKQGGKGYNLAVDNKSACQTNADTSMATN